MHAFKIATVALLAFILGLPAIAADKNGDRSSSLVPVGEVVAASSSWTGFYVGAHGGYGWGEWSGDFSYNGTALGHGYDLSSDNWLYGLQAGVNYQIGKMILGIEADVTWGDLDASGRFKANSAVDADSVDWEVRQKLERFGTARLRAGYLPTEKFMVYATGGLAWGEVSASQVIHYPKGNPVPYINGYGSVDETHIGWAAGGGFEWMLMPNVTLRAEYLYLDFGQQDYHFVGKSGKPPTAFYAKDQAPSDLDFHVVRAGLNFKF